MKMPCSAVAAMTCWRAVRVPTRSGAGPAQIRLHTRIRLQAWKSACTPASPGGGHAEGDVLYDIENLRGSAYADILEGDGNANNLDGGAGTDWLSYRGSDAGVTVKLAENSGTGGHAEGDVITNVENLEGSDYNDVLGGNGAANHLKGGAGNDGLWGSSGDDILEGGAGADRMFGSIGVDWVIYPGSETGVTVNLENGSGAGGHAQGDTITDVENIRGSDHDDVLTGDSRANRLNGAGGNDVLEGGEGIDRLDGGAGIDTAVYWASDAAVTVDLANGTGRGGHAEGDVITGVENLWGSDHADTLSGDNGANRLSGGSGDDELLGNGGDDILEGGSGADRFIFGRADGDDIILDFADNEDLIDLSETDLSGFADLTLSSAAGAVTIDMTASGGGTILLEDFDITNLDASDFIF